MRSDEAGADLGALGDDAHSMAVLSIAPGSRVLDVGAGPGLVARRLRERSCQVTAIEVDPSRAESAARWCEAIVVGDVESLDLGAELRPASFDVIVLLDVLEHLKDPAKALKGLIPFLAPNGTVVASMPNVTHAAVRLQLLGGRFATTEQGLLDRTHLHFFDRPAAESLLEGADLVITDRLRVRRGLTETEIEIDPDRFPPEVVATALSDPDSLTYQFILLATPRVGPDHTAQRSLASVLQGRLERTQDALGEAGTYASHLEDHIGEITAASEHLNAALVDARARNTEVEAALVERLAELEVIHRELRHLEADLEIKEAYGRELHEQLRTGQEAIAYLQSELAVAANQVTALDAELVAIRNRVTSRLVSRAERALLSHPLLRKGVLAVTRRVAR